MNEKRPPVTLMQGGQLKEGVITFTDFLKIALAVAVGVFLAIVVLKAIEADWASVPVTPVEQDEGY